MSHRVLAAVLAGAIALTASVRTESLPQDRGAVGVWQKLLKLQTIASAMQTTAHPDDEHGGVLAWLSRGLGARVALATLTRGESGDNAIGPELFDAVGLIRTEELRRAGEYYGLDHQYFTTAIDYGFSKRLDEALEKWGRDAVLRDMVAIIRTDRPLVLISRFQGNARDGHGNHQAAGLITRDAFGAAGDPNMFPEQLARGLRPWQPLKLYIGGMREDEDWTVRVDSGQYSPWLGDSYANLARMGLAFQRSQNGGRVPRAQGPAFDYYKRLASRVTSPDRETSFFDGIDTGMSAVFRTLGRTEPAFAGPLLASIAQEITNAVRAFSSSDPGASVPALARGLATTRQLIDRVSSESDVVFVLKIKEQQFQDAINAALGVELTALAQRATTAESTGAPSAFGPVVPGQTFDVRVTFTRAGVAAASGVELSLASPATWRVAELKGTSRGFRVTVPADAPPSRPFFSRSGITESRYAVKDPAQLYRPASAPLLVATARYAIEGIPVEVRQDVTRLESNVPYGDESRELSVLPALAVNMSPSRLVVPLTRGTSPVDVRVEIVNNSDGASSGTLRLETPPGWSVTPPFTPFSFSRAGERTTFAFSIAVPALGAGEHSIRAIASADGRSYGEGYDAIQHRDLETRYLFKDASLSIRGVDVAIAANLRIGYVMGIGDEVPSAIAQLGAKVQLLTEADLANGDLERFDTIVTGTRAYAVRDDLKTYNRRLLDYVKNGGNLVVLYNTQEYVPASFAPYPGQLTARAEEVSEEDAPVQILQATHAVFNAPNRITPADFDGWVEQRGSKFWDSWSDSYTPMIETHDRGQAPQRGGWLWARYGKGQYTYVAYAFHRQLPYAVPGAYRLLANVLSLGKTASASTAPAPKQHALSPLARSPGHPILSRMSKALLASATVGLCLASGWASTQISAQSAKPRPSLAAPVAGVAADESATQTVKQYCAGCHSDRGKAGGLSLAGFDVARSTEQIETSEKIIRKLRASMMPPAGARRPDEAILQDVRRALETHMDRYAAANPNPGWRPFQRLTRAEYAQSIRDLLDIDVDVTAYLPPDTMSQGFDNIADTQGFSPALPQGYLRAASQISRLAVGDRMASPTTATYRVLATENQMQYVEGTPFGSRGGAAFVHTFPADGLYKFHATLVRTVSGELFGNTAVHMAGKNELLEISVNGDRVAVLEVEKSMNDAGEKGLTLETPPIPIKAGPQRIAAAFVPRAVGPVDDLLAPIEQTLIDTRIGTGYGVTMAPHLQELAVAGPMKVTGISDTPSRRKIFTCHPTTPAQEQACAADILRRLATQAYRGPVRDDLNDLLGFYMQARKEGGNFDEGVRFGIQGILANPRFMFRVEQAPTTANDTYRLSDADLASRLSYFLWGTLPDQELLKAAGDGSLKNPAAFDRQVARMVADPRSRALSTRFAAQWLRLQDVDKVRPDGLLFPNWDGSLTDAFVRETELFFDSIVRENRSVLDLITADYTFVNERLARHYGIQNVTGPEFRRVALPDSRRGLLTQGSILLLTSVADRTSPVQRGKWVLQVMLGAPPPPPPPNVPALEDTKGSADGRFLSVRERMEQHRSNPACVSCHRVIDPIGLALENFDVVGRYRIKDNGVPVDSTGTLYDGTQMEGVIGLRTALLKHRDAFIMTFAENLMTYALGRRVEASDMPALRAIARDAASKNNQIGAFIAGITRSQAFQMSRRAPAETTTGQARPH